MATQGTAQDPCETSFMANNISHSIPDDGTTLQRNEEITVVPHVSDSTLPPTLMLTLHMVPAEPPSSGETSLQQIDTSGEPRSSSSSPTTARSYPCLQCTLIADTDVLTSIGATGALHDAPDSDPNSPLSIEAHQPALSTPDIVEHAS